MAHMHLNRIFKGDLKNVLFLSDEELAALRDMVHWEIESRREAITQGSTPEDMSLVECEAVAKALHP